MQHHAADERHALSETLRRAGPDAATLCGEWTTAALAAHLVLRERSLGELAGRLPVARLRRHAEDLVQELAASTPYDQLVDTVARGPQWTETGGRIPIAWLWSVPAVSEQVNLLEYLVHHEDVRRAGPGWEPRVLPAAVQQAVWSRLALAAKATLRAVPVGVVLRSPADDEIRTRLARRGAPTVIVSGDPVELALFAFGRLAVAEVVLDGAPGDVEAVRTADISL